MRKAKSAPGSLTAIEAAKTKLEAQIAELDAQAKRFRDMERDAGRKTLLAALNRVPIPQMSRAQAKAIGIAIGTMSPADLIAAISVPSGA